MIELDVVIENGVPQGVVVGQEGRTELHLGVVIRVASNLIEENTRMQIDRKQFSSVSIFLRHNYT